MASLLLIACIGCSGKRDAAADATPPPAPVQTVIARAGTIAPSLQIAGVIAPYRQVAVTANLSEPLSEVDVIEGQHVRAGTVLARQLVDDLEAQLASAQRVATEDAARLAQTQYQTVAATAQNETTVDAATSSLREAEVNLSGAQTDLRRYETLAASGYIPRQTLDQQRVVVATDRQAVAAARATLNAARVNRSASGNGLTSGSQREDVAAAQAAVAAAEQSVRQLQLEIARAVIVAPVDGIIEAANANPGEYPSGRQLFTIEQTAKVYAVLSASSAQVVNIRIGAAASIETNTSYSANPRLQKDRGTVEAVLDQLQPGTTNFTVKVVVTNPDQHLHAGMPVNAFVALPVVRGTVIPLSAFIDDTHSSVYTVASGTVHLADVGEVADDGANAVVTGLANGTVVVKSVTAQTIGNGDRVSPK